MLRQSQVMTPVVGRVCRWDDGDSLHVISVVEQRKGPILIMNKREVGQINCIENLVYYISCDFE